MDSRSKLIHSVAATADNVNDSRLMPNLLHVGETRVWGDSAHAGQGEVIRCYVPRAKDFTQKKGNCPDGSGDRQESYQVEGPGQGRTSFPDPQAHPRLRQGPLPGPRLRMPTGLFVGSMRARESVHGARQRPSQGT